VFFKQWLFTAGHPQLALSWKYDTAKGSVRVQVEQQQSGLYDTPLEISIDGQLHTFLLKDKLTTFDFPATSKPATIIADPNVNLLATVTVVPN